MVEDQMQLHSQINGVPRYSLNFDYSHKGTDSNLKAEDIAEYISDLLVSLESLATKAHLYELAQLITKARDEANIHMR